MRVGLYQIDGKMPNLALMKLSTFYKRQNYKVELNPSRPGNINIASVIFTWNRPEVEKLRQVIPNLDVGGPGWDFLKKLPEEVMSCPPDYSLYGIDYGLGRLTIGCPRRCPWCISWRAEPLVRLADEMNNIINRKSRFIVLLDDNLLKKPDFLEDLALRKLKVNFNQGLDIRLVNHAVSALLARVRFFNFRMTKRQLHFAFDSLDIEGEVRSGVFALNRAGIGGHRLMFYMLVGYGHESFEEEMERFEILRGLGVDPFVMPFRDRDGKVKLSLREKHFARWVNKRIYKSCPWGEYRRYQRVRLQEAQTLLPI